MPAGVREEARAHTPASTGLAIAHSGPGTADESQHAFDGAHDIAQPIEEPAALNGDQLGFANGVKTVHEISPARNRELSRRRNFAQKRNGVRSGDATCGGVSRRRTGRKAKSRCYCYKGKPVVANLATQP